VEYLAAGQTKVEQFNITVSDGQGGSIVRTVNVTITGTNDAPVVSVGDVTGGVTEQTGTPTGNLTDTGAITFTDVDLTDVHTITTAAVGTPLGTLSAVKNTDTTGTGTGGQLTWTYSVADSAVEYLAAGQTKVEQFNITVSDGQGGSIVRTVNVTITGTNDAPVVSVVGAYVTGSEDAPLVLSWANFNVSDVDTAASNLSIKVMTVPTDGTLQYNISLTATPNWIAVTANQLITQGDIAAGKLRFVPDLHESGADVFGGSATGNLKSDYASFTYEAFDGVQSSATTAIARIDITPVVDAPTLVVANNGVEIFRTSWEQAGTGTPTSGDKVLNNQSAQYDSATFAGDISGTGTWTRINTNTVGVFNQSTGGTDVFEFWQTGDTPTAQNSTTPSVSAATGNGNWFLELNDATATNAQTLGIQRSVTTQTGLVYDLALDYAGRVGFSTNYTKIAVLVDGVVVGSYAATSPQTALDWSNLRFSFTGTGTSQTIKIITDANRVDDNGRGAMIDDIALRSAQGAIQGNSNGGTETSIGLAQYISSALVDTDTSESLSITLNSIPAGALIYTAAAPLGLVPLTGSVTLTATDLASARIVLPSTYSGPFSLGVTATSTEVDGTTATVNKTLNLEVLKSGVTVTGIDDPGINDAPIANDDTPVASVTEDAASSNSLSGNALTGAGGSGNVADSDPEGSAITVTGIAAGAPATNPSGGVNTTISGLYGTLTIATSGAYTYTLDNTRAATQNLIAGQVAADVFTYTISDGTVTDSATITIKVNGAMDLTAITPPSTLVNASGLNGEYYGYNDSESGGVRTHADDNTASFGNSFGATNNLNSVEDLEKIINGRNIAAGGGNIVGTEVSAVLNAVDVRFTATKVDYYMTGDDLGQNNVVNSGNVVTTGTNNRLAEFLNYGGDLNATTKAESGLGDTTDAAMRLTGQIFFERGNYDFRVFADDGFRLKIAGETLIEFDGNQAPTTRVFRNVEVDDRIEGLQPFELIYWEQGGNARLRIEYKLSSDSTFKTLSLDNVALFTNENAPIVADRRTQEIAETATNRQYELRTGAVLDGDSTDNILTGNLSRDFIQGGGGADTLYGMGGADYLEGGSGNDTLYGGDGPDILDGGLGADNMIGGLGDDIFVIDNAGDTVSDTGGTDSIELAAGYNANYTLAAGFENIKLQGSNAINATGNSADNRMIGNDGDNTLDGGSGSDRLLGGMGSDRLTGGLGSDVFEWNLADRSATPGNPYLDVITDFTYGVGFNNMESGTAGVPVGGGDRIDLRDLLLGEQSSLLNTGGVTPEIGNLLKYLDITTEVVGLQTNTVIHISSTGSFDAAGTYDPLVEDQRITLQGVNLFTDTGTSTETALLQTLLKNGTLIVD
jgi:VCBS repeat-containing protein